MAYILLVITLLSGGLLYAWNKKKQAEALLENLDSKEKVNDLQGKVTRNAALLDVEEELRKKAQENAEKEKKDVSDENLIDFFNNRKR